MKQPNPLFPIPFCLDRRILIAVLAIALSPLVYSAPTSAYDRSDELLAEPYGETPQDLEDKELAAARRAFLKARYEYLSVSLEHRRRVFAWQHFSDPLIFFVVLAMVASGLWLSWLQFRQSLRAGGMTKMSKEERTQGASPPEVSELEVSTNGLKVRSSVMGIIVLAISLAFFYLYLAHVYPVTGV